MLSEGYKVNLRREAGKMAARKVAKEGIAAKRAQLARAKKTRYAIGGFVVGSAMSHMISKPVTKAKRWLILKDVQRSNKKLMKKKAKMQQMDEGYLWDKIKPHLQKSKVGGQLLKKHGPKLQKGLDYAWGSKAKVAAKAGSMALKHPVAGLIGTTALAVGGGAMKGIASDFIKHKARMKMDPNYAQQTRHAAEAEKQLKSNVKSKPIQGTNPSMEANTPNTQDEHPSPIASKVAKKGHQKHHAHSAVLRGMDPTKINTVGKAAKNYQLTNRTKTNTRKESYMNLDNIIERTADTVYAIEEGEWTNVAKAAGSLAKTAWKNRGVIARGLRDKAKPHIAGAIKKARTDAQKGLDY
ncbi:MAG: hypothetical protein JRD89_13700, partial [Deltaproteobacteria bacterium]|nr:hypothetical protein [Deltaproteobacteria bacterium]